MDALFQYIQAINEMGTALPICNRVVNTEQSSDEWSATQVTTQTVHFENGAVIKQVVEQDVECTEVNDEVCRDCWINYQVMQQPQHSQISPQQKQFTNLCQQSFWLKIQAAQFC